VRQQHGKVSADAAVSDQQKERKKQDKVCRQEPHTNQKDNATCCNRETQPRVQGGVVVTTDYVLLFDVRGVDAARGANIQREDAREKSAGGYNQAIRAEAFRSEHSGEEGQEDETAQLVEDVQQETEGEALNEQALGEVELGQFVPFHWIL